MEFVPTVALSLLVVKLVDFGRAVTEGAWTTARTQVIAWVAGVIAVFLAAETDFAASIAVGEWSLASLNVFSQVLLGLTVASAGSFLHDVQTSMSGS